MPKDKAFFWTKLLPAMLLFCRIKEKLRNGFGIPSKFSVTQNSFSFQHIITNSILINVRVFELIHYELRFKRPLQFPYWSYALYDRLQTKPVRTDRLRGYILVRTRQAFKYKLSMGLHANPNPEIWVICNKFTAFSFISLLWEQFIISYATSIHVLKNKDVS